MKKYFFVLLSIVALASCRKQVTGYEHPEFEAKPVLNAILTAGEPVWAQVSLAQCLDSVHPSICRDAEVLLFVDGEFAETLQYDEGAYLYIGNTIAESGKQYTYKIAVTGHDTLTACTTVPPVPVFRGLEVIENGYLGDEANMYPSFLLTFTTNPNEIRYYSAEIGGTMKYSKGKRWWQSMGSITTSEYAEDPVLLDAGTMFLIFSNSIINDTTYTMKINGRFNTSYGGIYDSLTDVEPLHGKFVVRMEGLSESLYDYLKSRYTKVELNAFGAPFLSVITPFNQYSNVENGYGIFGARACYVSDTIYYNEACEISRFRVVPYSKITE